MTSKKARKELRDYMIDLISTADDSDILKMGIDFLGENDECVVNLKKAIETEEFEEDNCYAFHSELEEIEFPLVTEPYSHQTN